MPISRKLEAKEVALAACFTALYVVLSFLPMFRLIGAFARAVVTGQNASQGSS
jgi:hypothetical protein